MGQHDSAAETDAVVARADALNQLGRHDEALRLVSPVLAHDPQHLGANVTAAVSLLNTGRVQEARPVLQRVAQAHPDAADPLRLLSYAAVQLREGSTAVGCARRAVELEPWGVESHIQLSVALTCARDHLAAVAAARRAVELAPSSAGAHLALVGALFPDGANPPESDLTRAERHVQLALSLEPGNAIAHNELGRIAMARGQPFAAASALTRAVITDPRQDVALDNISLVFGLMVLRAHYVMFVLWFMARAAVKPVPVARLGLWLTEAIGVSVLAWTVIKLRAASGQGMARGLVREFARRDPLGAAWCAAVMSSGLALVVMGFTSDELTRALLWVVGGCLAGGAILSWVRAARRKARG
ncbi:MAG: tetratricopeptide repeat protein [Dermatophilaceae bacterium]